MSCNESPARSMRRASCFRLKPLSTRTRVAVEPSRASTTSALPLLPEPRLQARSTPRPALAQLVAQQRQDPVAGRRPLRCAVGTKHSHDRPVRAFAGHDDAVLQRRNRLVAGEDLGEEALLLLLLRLVIRVEVADEV